MSLLRLGKFINHPASAQAQPIGRSFQASPPVKISFCLITLNEEQNLARCLRSCSDLADEIIVVDSGSTDRTAKIVHDFGARWIEQPWLGFVGQKNRAIELAAQDWVFSIDADEELSRELHTELRELKLHPPGVE